MKTKDSDNWDNIPEDNKWNLKPCLHPQHFPPNMMVFPPEGYKHKCPACGKEQMCYGSRIIF